MYILSRPTLVKVVLEGCCRCPDSHDLSAYHHLYDLGRHIAALRSSRPLDTKNLFPPISWTALTLTPKNYSWKPSGTTLNFYIDQCWISMFIFILSTVDLSKSRPLFNSMNILALKVISMDSRCVSGYLGLDHFYIPWIQIKITTKNWQSMVHEKW